MKNNFLPSVVVWLGLLSIAGCSHTPLTRQAIYPMPNIVIIVADDLGWNDVSYHGSDIQTPNIDELAQAGIVLNRFYTAPLCTPTRAGLLTGTYPDRFGMRKGVVLPRTIGGLPPEAQTLAEFLAAHGYRHRGAFGKWHLGHSSVEYLPLNQGFTEFYGHYNGAIDYFSHQRGVELDWHSGFDASHDKGYSTDLIEQAAIAFMQKAQVEGPFFCYIAFNAPHAPLQAKQQDLLKYGYTFGRPNQEFPQNGQRDAGRESDMYGNQERGNTKRQIYSAMVTALDESIGHLVTALKKQGAYDNTVIWFLSDNGGAVRRGGDNTPLRGHKNTLWEGGVRTVSMVKMPGTKAPVQHIDQVIAYIDVFPTIAAIIGATDIPSLDGVSVTPALQGDELPRRWLYLGKDAVVSDEWKWVDNQLFKIAEDPGEENNVASLYPALVHRFRDQTQAFATMNKGGYTMQPKTWQPPKNWQISAE